MEVAGDGVIDSSPVGAGTVTLDSLVQGVPVVTLPGAVDNHFSMEASVCALQGKYSLQDSHLRCMQLLAICDG